MMGMTIEEWLNILDLISKVVSIIGIPVGIALYYHTKMRERMDREYGTYNALDEKYLDYLRQCIEHPELDLYYVPLETRNDDAPSDGKGGEQVALTPAQKVQQMALFEILFSQMERAYLMYYGHNDNFRNSQWKGWDVYIQIWKQRKLFQELVRRVDAKQYDEGFWNYLKIG